MQIGMLHMISCHDTVQLMNYINLMYTLIQCGVKNGMLMGPARKLCPDLVPIPYDFEGYNEVSKCLYDTIAR